MTQTTNKNMSPIAELVTQCMVQLNEHWEAQLQAHLLPLQQQLEQVRKDQGKVTDLATDQEQFVTMRAAAAMINGRPKASVSDPRGYREIRCLREWGILPTDHAKRVRVSDCRRELSKWKEHLEANEHKIIKLRKTS